MSAITALGLAAALCTTGSFLPQVVRNGRTRSTGDLSFVTFGTLALGVFLWLVYGVLTDDVPIMASNAVTFALLGVNLVQMVRYRPRPQG